MKVVAMKMREVLQRSRARESAESRRSPLDARSAPSFNEAALVRARRARLDVVQLWRGGQGPDARGNVIEAMMSSPRRVEGASGA